MKSNELVLVHHGVKGQKWGVRRYQNEDGSLTAAGRKQYDKNLGERSTLKKVLRFIELLPIKQNRTAVISM